MIRATYLFGLMLGLSGATLFADEATEKKAEQLQQQASEAQGRRDAAAQALLSLQEQVRPAQQASQMAKAVLARDTAALVPAEKELPPKVEAATKALAEKDASEKLDIAAKGMVTALTEELAAQEKLLKSVQDAVKTATDNAVAAKAAVEKNPGVQGFVDFQTEADKSVINLNALVTMLTERIANVTKGKTDSEAVTKTTGDKFAADTKLHADAAAAQKAAEDLVNQLKASVEAAQKQQTEADAMIASYQPDLDKAIAQLAAAAVDALSKQKQAEEAQAALGKFVAFSKEIAPIFVKRCLACHNARTAKGRYNMETFAGVMKGGEQGDTIIPHDGELSVLSTMVADGSMPKDADPLTKDEVALIKKWIQLGAKLDTGVAPDAALVTVMPKLPQPNPPDAYRAPLAVTALAYSPDGSTLASSGYHEIILWNVADGSLKTRIKNIAERVYDLQFSPDGTMIAAAAGTPGQMGEVKLFRSNDGTLIKDLVTTSDAMHTLSFSADGTRLASGGADRSIRVFNVASGKQELLIEDHADWVMGIAWAPDGTKLASASRDKTSKVFDAKSGESLVTFPGHAEAVYGVAFSPNGQEVVTSGRDRQIRIWNVTNAQQARAIAGFGNEVYKLIVTPDGRIFSSSADQTAREHRFDNGQPVRTFTGHKDFVYTLAFHPGMKQLASGSWDGEIRIWNAEDAMGIRDFVAAPGLAKPAPAAAAAQ